MKLIILLAFLTLLIPPLAVETHDVYMLIRHDPRVLHPDPHPTKSGCFVIDDQIHTDDEMIWLEDQYKWRCWI